MIEIYTDGACSGNPGPGGWGFVIINGNDTKSYSGSEASTTNNRMELTAAIKAIESVDTVSYTHLTLPTSYAV